MFQHQWIEQAKENNRKAQLKLYRMYCDGMFGVAMRFLKNVEDAEDATQEAFIKAFRKLHQYRGEVTFGAWLKKIVIHKCIDALKMKKEQETALHENYIHIADDENDWTVEDDGITVEDVKKAIVELPEKYRYVVMLYLVEGYDHSEISEILNISETTSRTQLMRGKQKLRAQLTYTKNGTGH
ncbi:MAG: RNA polymerase sigma factor [Sinomicrobium sp.]|nr:RNA polymerase sigma factor [Sinomicrobium sp.]